VDLLTRFLGRLCARPPQAGPETDPEGWFGILQTLPNPDPILRHLGYADQVYDSILVDAHVTGEARSLRGALYRLDWRLVSGDPEDAQATRALELCREQMAKPPNPIAGWGEVIWQMVGAILAGYRVHELVWERRDGLLWPQVIDRLRRRFAFDPQGNLLLRSRGQSYQGALTDPRYFVVSRHEASTGNPYGRALLSALFWPWTFKTGGFKYFVRYCERHGLPWPVARYPAGTSDSDQRALEEAVAHMIEAGYLVIPEGDSIELLTPTGSGQQLPQQSLIELCDRQMSKALTGQAYVAEPGQTGARAASEVAETRQYTISDADRTIAVAGMNKIFRLATTANLGPEVAAPKLEFYTEVRGGKEWAEVYQIASQLSDKVSETAFLQEMGLEAAADDSDALRPAASAAPPAGGQAPAQFAAPAPDDPEPDLAALDATIEEDLIEPLRRAVSQYAADGRSLQDLLDHLADILPEMDDRGLTELTSLALSQAALEGMRDA